MAANFERKMKNRVIITGHGSYRRNDPKITVPNGKRIHFYVAHGVALDNDVGMAVEGFEGGQLPPAFETFESGEEVYDYILTYPSGLTLHGTQKNFECDWITVRHKGQAVPLSTLLKDSRCVSATDIHWAACRSRADWLAPDTHDAHYRIRPVGFSG
jgi:hypothetical protein